jgi:hypothetical protein
MNNTILPQIAQDPYTTKLTDWLLEQDIIIPETIATFDIDEIKPLGHLETRQPKNVKPIYSELFEEPKNNETNKIA